MKEKPRPATGNTQQDPPATTLAGVLPPRYEPPRILSLEALEAVASTCDGTGGVGKSISPPYFCSPQSWGS